MRCIASGTLAEVALAAKSASAGEAEPILVFDHATGAVIDVDLRGDPAAIMRHLADRSRQHAAETQRPADAPTSKRGRGRPKLGVVSREVTLLPRHWHWLAAQPGGASQALRRLVEEARRNDGGETARRAAREAAYRFMTAIAGNLPGYEEAVRALFADDQARFLQHIATWPKDVRVYAEQRAFGSPEFRLG